MHQKAFELVKASICKETTLAYFDRDKETTIQVGASGRGLGVVLLQYKKPIAHASKSLTDAEKRYANIERELLAVVFGAERFHTYVYGKHFKVESDHKPLEMIQLKNLTAAPPRLQRPLLRIQKHDMNQNQNQKGIYSILTKSLYKVTMKKHLGSGDPY